MSYLKLFKAGAKHELLVNDQPRGCDSMVNLVNTQGEWVHNNILWMSSCQGCISRDSTLNIMELHVIIVLSKRSSQHYHDNHVNILGTEITSL